MRLQVVQATCADHHKKPEVLVALDGMGTVVRDCYTCLHGDALLNEISKDWD